MVLTLQDDHIDFNALKVNPLAKKQYVNYGFIYSLFELYKNSFDNDLFICDGSRSINHKTNFQEFLCKNFNFRKCYCNLHVKIRPSLKPVFNFLYLIRKFLLIFDHFKFIHLINSSLKMIECAKMCEKRIKYRK